MIENPGDLPYRVWSANPVPPPPPPYDDWRSQCCGHSKSNRSGHTIACDAAATPWERLHPGETRTFKGQPKVEEQPDVRNEHEVKQVILIRRDLGMRRGKEIAQGSHASIAFLTNAVHEKLAAEDTGELSYPMSEYLTEAQRQWIDGMFTKVTLQVHSEEELMSYHLKAKAAGVTSHIIQDSGRTEFGGVATYTTCAIGPDWSEAIDEITGDLKLY